MTQYRNPVPTVDIIIEVAGGIPAASSDHRSAGGARTGIVLIERKNPPLGWALPGGFVDEGEAVSAAAIREALEETSLEVTLTEQFFCYSAPDRDPRRHTISVVFLARADGKPVAADDARAAAVFPADALPSPLVFDHAKILSDYLRYRKTGRRPPPTR